ncbi:hypothetical protein [Croceimicrobium sp.]|uniref:hypothetical protein n=1 Tax=Croceimicrobium sp. TaxID=2828340 RepID=UPI003BAD2AD3
MIRLGFIGSSADGIADQYTELVDKLLRDVFSRYEKVKIVTGGYHGFMKSISKTAKVLVGKEFPNVYLEVYGILGTFQEKPNRYLDKVEYASNLGDRVEAIIEHSDYLVGLPGSNGTLHEILHALQAVQYFPGEYSLSLEDIFLHEFWKGRIDVTNDAHFFKDLPIFLEKSYHSSSFIANDDLVGNNIPSQVIGRIEEIIGSPGQNILALDFAHYFKSTALKIDTGQNSSYAIQEYFIVLSEFLLAEGSLLTTDTSTSQYKLLNNELKNLASITLEESSVNLFRKSSKESEQDTIRFNKWNFHLEQRDFGKTSFWVNKNLKIQDVEINLSCFLILDIELTTKKCHAVLQELHKYIFSFGLYDSIKRLGTYMVYTDELDKFKNNAIANKHTIFNHTPSLRTFLDLSIDDVNARKYDHLPQYLNRINSSFQILDFSNMATYQYLDREHELYGKTLSYYISFLEKHHIYNQVLPVVNIDEEAGELITIKEDMVEVFLLIWNIWNNAAKNTSKDSSFTVSLKRCKNHLQLTISNNIKAGYFEEAKMAIEYLLYDSKPVKISGGLVILKEILQNLAYCNLNPEHSNVSGNLYSISLNFSYEKP